MMTNKGIDYYLALPYKYALYPAKEGGYVIEIPEPVKEDYSGKFNVRVPKSLHKYLSELAKKENISLNQLILYHLSRSAGYKG